MAEKPLPLFDLQRQWPMLREEAMATFERIAAAGAFSLGEELEAFEAEWAAYCGSRHAIGVSSGTAAIELALRGLGIGPGDEVITVAHTFVATVEAIAATGARPVLVDIDPATRCIDPVAAGAAVGPRTKAVVAVHLYGRPAPMDELSALGVPIIEDAAQAHGATLGGRRIGSLGAAGCFSFYPTKNLGAMGDGGAVVTDDGELAAAVRSLRHHGAAPHDANHHVRCGGTARLDNLQAAILRLKLRHLDSDNEQRRWSAERYRQALIDLPLGLPEDGSGGRAVHHLFVVDVDERDRVRTALRAANVLTGVHYPTPVHLQPGWAWLRLGPGDLPATERASARALSLPCFPGMREEEQDQVVEALRRILA